MYQDKKYLIDIKNIINVLSCEDASNMNKENYIKKDDKKNEYAFIRLYEFEFKSDKKYLFEKALKSSVNFFSESNSPGRYSHAAINYTLKDGFFGLYWVAGADNDVKVETISEDHTDPKHYFFAKDIHKSKYAIYAYPLTKQEYTNLSYNLEKTKESNNYKYQIANFILSIFSLSKDKVRDFIREKTGRENVQRVKNVEEFDTKKQLVCSTFVMYILENSDKNLVNWRKNEKINMNSVTPSKLASIPGARLLFKGTWANYNKDAANFCKQNPEFKKYL